MDMTVHFSISGEWLTGMARDLVYEGNWRKGLNLLVKGLQEMSFDTAVSILKGDKRLVGENHLELVDETPEEKASYFARLDSMYGRCAVADEKLWRPYARALGWNRDDMEYFKEWRRGTASCSANQAFRKVYLATKEKMQCGLVRSMYYARNPMEDIAVAIDDYTIVLFEPASFDLPFWSDHQKGFADVCKDVQLQTYGAFEQSGAPVVPNPEDLTNEMDAEEPPADSVQMSEPQSSVAGTSNMQVRRYSDAEKEAYLAQKDAHSRLEENRKRIIAFADADTEYGWRTLERREADGTLVTVRVPGRAFICYAMSSAGIYDERMPKYSPFCQSGEKMLNDNPYHTDAWLGAGLPLDDAYDLENPEHLCFMSGMFEVQRELLSYELQVLASAGRTSFSGRVYTPDTIDQAYPDDRIVLAIPHAGVEFDLLARKAEGVICEVGGKLAHLVTVARETGVPVVRMDNAMKLLPTGHHVYVDVKNGKIDLQ